MFSSRNICAIILCSVFLGGAAAPAAPVDDTGMLLPPPDHVITQNITKLAVPRIIGNDTLKQVIFRVCYSQLATNKVSYSRTTQTVAIDTIPPFETVWDCSHAPDMDITKLHFQYELTDIHGRILRFDDPNSQLPVTTGTPYINRQATLDRNPDSPDRHWQAAWVKEPVTVDGHLDEWDPEQAISFTNNDNRITAAVTWDTEHLNLAVTVADAQVSPHTGTAPDHFSPYVKDGIEWFLDLNDIRRSYRNNRTFQVLLLTTGIGEFPYVLTKQEEMQGVTRPAYHPQFACTVHDSGYTMEMALAWSELKSKPSAGLTLGMNLANTDLDNTGGVAITGSWAGISDLVHHNPSEWGTLHLQKPAPAGTTLILGCIGSILLIAGILMFLRRRTAGSASPETQEPRDPVIRHIQIYIAEHLGDEQLNLQQLAAHVNLSSAYLRQLYKKATGENITDYLNRQRADRAAELLSTTNKQITEIGFEAGFGTYQTFNRVFKKLKGVTPGEYREQQSASE